MLWTLLSLLAIPVVYYVYIELKAYFRVMRYKKQGVKHVEYLTLPAFMSKIGKSAKMDDMLASVKKEMNEQDPNQPFKVMNFGSTCYLTLISEKAIKDFYAQETQVSIKKSPFDKVKFMGFLFENGKEVQEKRAIFSKIFHYSNVLNLMPAIRNVVKHHVRKLKQRAEAEGGQVKIDLKKEFSRNLLDDISGCVLMRGAENKMTEKFEGMNITQIIQKYSKLLNTSLRNPLKLIPFASALGLLKEEKEMRRLKKALIEIVRKEYNKRYNQQYQSLYDKSVLDIMVKLNKESEKETGQPKFSIEEITSNFELFQAAASDTSFHYSCSTITFLALPENQKYQKRIQEQVETKLGTSDSYSNDELNSLKELDNVFREAGRLANPATGISRDVIKDFKVDGYTVYKGDNVVNLTINYEAEHFKDPFKFNPDRFNADSPDFKRAPKLKQTPFSHGQRSCLGKYLGEMMVKLIVVELLKEFEATVEPGYEVKFG